jgi:hypothetical protein
MRTNRRRRRRDGYLQLWNRQRTLPEERLVLDPDSVGKYRMGYGRDHGSGSESRRPLASLMGNHSHLLCS